MFSGALIGMIHVLALPGTPYAKRTVREIAQQAAGEARVLREAGFDAVMVENRHERPYVQGQHGPQTTAVMTRVALEVRAVFEGPMGVQVLSGGEREAVAVALSAGCEFVRVENFVFAHVADEGLLHTACAGALLRYRREIGAEHVKVFADIKKKHASHAITADTGIEDCARAAEFFGADGVIVSGQFTGQPTSVAEVASVKRACGLPVLVGSGVTPEQAPALLGHADGLIVGTWIKQRGRWEHPVDPERCRQIVEAVGRARRQ